LDFKLANLYTDGIRVAVFVIPIMVNENDSKFYEISYEPCHEASFLIYPMFCSSVTRKSDIYRRDNLEIDGSRYM
jgi:hypothetical protein